jgi:L-rhamnose isomerase
MVKSGLYAYHDHLQATNKFYLAAVLLSDSVIETVRRELRRLSDATLTIDDLRSALMTEVIKREVIEGEKADAARKKVGKAAAKMLRTRRVKEDEDSPVSETAQQATSVPDERSSGTP